MDDPRSDLAELLADPERALAHPEAAVRRIAIAAADGADPRIAALATADPDATVRAEAVEALGRRPGATTLAALRAARDDPDPRVVEAVATAYGELGANEAVAWLREVAEHHPDRLVREAAVAALGAIGDERALPVLLRLVGDAPPQVRRRCVVALTVFDGPEVEAAIRSATRDRNPAVREAAQMIVGGTD